VLSFPVFAKPHLRPPAPLSGSPCIAHRALNPSLSNSYELFCHTKNRNSFVFLRFQTLYQKHPEWGYPRTPSSQPTGASPAKAGIRFSFTSSTSLTSYTSSSPSPSPSESTLPAQLRVSPSFGRNRPPPTPVESIFQRSGSVNSLESAHTRNMGEGVGVVVSVNQTSRLSSHRSKRARG
jgi:hypothetical protein